MTPSVDIEYEDVWTDETVHRLFDEGPDRVTPGSKMPMQRITREEDRADLIAFLRERAGTVQGKNGDAER